MKKRPPVYTLRPSVYDGVMLSRILPVACAWLLASAPMAMAQAMPSPAPAQSRVVSYVIAGFTLVAVIALGIMSAKRTHQD